LRYSTAPSKGVALVTYNTWFSSSGCNVHGLRSTGASSAGGPAADLWEAHWRPAPCITADNIPHSHLISLIKLVRTNSHGLNSLRILRCCGIHVLVSRTASGAERVLVVTPLVHCMMTDTLCVLECPHISEIRQRYPILFAGQVWAVGTHDMRTLFTDETLVAPLASFVHNMLGTSLGDEQHG
jgi:hypothetical protein